MPKLTVDELKKIREKAKNANVLREGGPFRVQVTVHMGTCGIAAGAREIMNVFMEEIEGNNLKDVLIKTSGCAGLCSHEPMITVEEAGKPPMKYVDLDAGKAREIFSKHVVEGNPVREYVLASGSERVL